MAVFTHIDTPMLEAFLADYALAPLAGFMGIQAGVQNSNFIIETQDAKYILTIYEDTATGVTPADLPYFVGLMQYLAAAGINCPTPIARRDGGLLSRLAEKPAALVSFLDGRGTITPKPQHCRSAGAALAAMHLAGRDFPHTRANDQGPENWQRVNFRRRHGAHRLIAGQKRARLGDVEIHIRLKTPSIEHDGEVIGPNIVAGEIEIDQAGHFAIDEKHIIGKQIGMNDAAR